MGVLLQCVQRVDNLGLIDCLFLTSQNIKLMSRTVDQQPTMSQGFLLSVFLNSFATVQISFQQLVCGEVSLRFRRFILRSCDVSQFYQLRLF